MGVICSVLGATKGIFMLQKTGIAAKNAVNPLVCYPVPGYQG